MTPDQVTCGDVHDPGAGRGVVRFDREVVVEDEDNRGRLREFDGGPRRSRPADDPGSARQAEQQGPEPRLQRQGHFAAAAEDMLAPPRA